MTRIIRSTVVYLCIFITNSCYSQIKASTYDSVSKDVNGLPYLKSRFDQKILKSQKWIKGNREFHLVLNTDTPATVNINENKADWNQYVQDHLQWPSKDIEGKVYMALLVDNKGSILDKRVIRSIEFCKECDLSAMKFVDKLPRFRPAKVGRKNVTSVKYLIIPFKTP